MQHFSIVQIIGFLFLCFSSLAASKTSQPELFNYSIKYLAQESNCLDIALNFKVSSKGESVLRLPRQPFKLSLHATKGKVKYKLLDKGELLIYSEPSVDLKVEHRACVLNPSRNNYYPIMEKDFFYFMADELLAVPGGDLSNKVKAAFHFENFPENYTIATNHQLNKKDYEVTTTVKDLGRSIMAGGNFPVETLIINNKPIHIILNGHWSMFSKNELKRQIYKIIKTQRTFLNDNNFPYFLMIIFDCNLPEKDSGVSGSFYDNVFTMLIIDGPQKHKPTAYGLISHELFHAWMGNKVTIPDPQGDLQWFIEGVNDFYGWQLALDAGVLTEENYVKYYNRILQEYYFSSYKTSSNQELAKVFQLRGPTGRLSMHRGHIVFMEILDNLQAHKKDRSVIDQALREIVATYSNQPMPISHAALDKIFRKHLGDKIWDAALKILYEGQPATFSPNLFSNRFVLKSVSRQVPHFGFSMDAFLKQMQIKSLEKNSNAYLAGLRENDKVLEASFESTTIKHPATLQVESAGQRKTISFMPEIVEASMPQYVINTVRPRKLYER